MRRKQRKFIAGNRKTAVKLPFSFALLLLSGVLCNNLLALVVAASLAYAVSKISLAALGALYKIGGSLKLPYAGASFHLS